jgi:hypothetical protein
MTRYVDGVPAAVAGGHTTLTKVEWAQGLATTGIVLAIIALVCALPYMLLMGIQGLYIRSGLPGGGLGWAMFAFDNWVFWLPVLGTLLPAALGLATHVYGARHELDSVRARAMAALLLGLAGMLLVVASTCYAAFS